MFYLAVLVGLLLRRRWLIWTGIAFLWLSSIPLVGGFLVRAAEGWAERIPASDAPIVDAIVVLSAGRTIAPGRTSISEWGDPDRFFGGVELFKAGKAPLLVFTEAGSPWEPDAPLEGEILAQHARALGIPPDHIVTTGQVLRDPLIFCLPLARKLLPFMYFRTSRLLRASMKGAHRVEHSHRSQAGGSVCYRSAEPSHAL